MASIGEEQIMQALKGVQDPDSGKDIVSAGMVSGVIVKEGNVGFAIEVDPKRGPQLEPLRKSAEKAVEAIPGVLSVTAVLTAHSGEPSGGAPSGAQPKQPQKQTEGGPTPAQKQAQGEDSRSHRPPHGPRPPDTPFSRLTDPEPASSLHSRPQRSQGW